MLLIAMITHFTAYRAPVAGVKLLGPRLTSEWDDAQPSLRTHILLDHETGEYDIDHGELLSENELISPDGHLNETVKMIEINQEERLTT